ncbi:UBA-like_superfamily [Hexamita inflata]|uniref:UBA-like superfamily n=1 Tax=Hexamita inflata TaxID=28002 RepID=A0AA86RBD6_9EUKA|nr:UBA-like superfamily [Hexamita inflata]
MKITHCSKEIAIYFLEEYEYDVDAAIKQFEADQQKQKLQQQQQQEHERVRKINEQSQIEAKLELDTQVRREQQIAQVIEFTGCSRDLAIMHLKQKYFIVNLAVNAFFDSVEDTNKEKYCDENSTKQNLCQDKPKLTEDYKSNITQLSKQVQKQQNCVKQLYIGDINQKFQDNMYVSSEIASEYLRNAGDDYEIAVQQYIDDQATKNKEINVTSAQMQCDDQNTDQDNSSDDATEETQEQNIFKQTVYVPNENNQIYPQNNLLFPQWNNQQYYYGYQPGHYVNQYQGQSVQYQNQFRQNYWQNQPQYCNNQQQNRNNYQNQTAYNAQNKLEFNVPRFNPNVKYEPINENFSSVQFK